MGAFTYDVCSNLGGFKQQLVEGVEAMLASTKEFGQKQKLETEVNSLLQTENAEPKILIIGVLTLHINDFAILGDDD